MSGVPPPTVAQALAAQATRFILAMRALPGGEQSDPHVARLLQERFPGLTGSQAHALLRRASNAEGAAYFAHIAPNTPPGAEDVQRPLPGCTGWRYIAHVQWTGPQGNYGNMTFSYDSPNSLSINQAETAIATETALQLAQQASNRNPNYPSGPGVAIGAVTIRGIERAC